MTDSFSRLWFPNSEYFNQFKNCRLVYLPWNGTTPESQKDFVRLLEILDLPLERLNPITQPTRFEKIVLPDKSFYHDGATKFTNEYRETINQIRDFGLKNRTPTSSKKLYFFYGNKEVGEERLAEYFKSKGYEIITHKQRSASFDETLNLLINCESFASPLGSCAHNSVFLRDGTQTIMIPRSARAYVDYQQSVDLVRSLNANYVDSTLSVFNVGHNSFCFIVSEQLKRFFGDKWNGYEEGDFKTFLDYVNSPVRQGRKINLNEVRGYDSVFTDFMEQLKRREDLIAAYNMPPDWDKFKSQLTYLTHVHMKGSWTDGLKFENQISNPLDQKFDVLAIRIDYPGYKIHYSVYYNEQEGWTEEVTDNKWAGVTNRQKPIYGMKVRFDEAGAKEFSILYRMHKFDDTWTPWAKNGEELLSDGIKVNAIQIKLEPVNTQTEKAVTPQPQIKEPANTQPAKADTPQPQTEKTVNSQPAKVAPSQPQIKEPANSQLAKVAPPQPQIKEPAKTQPAKVAPPQPQIKEPAKTQPAKVVRKRFDYTQIFLQDNNEAIYLQGQRQDINQI